jgi:hypothetical protein
VKELTREQEKTSLCSSLVGRRLGGLGGRDMTRDVIGLQQTLAGRRVGSDFNSGDGLVV